MIRLYKMLLTTIGKLLPVSYHPFGKIIGNNFRCWCVRHIAKEMGQYVNIERWASVQVGVILKDNSSVGVNCLVGQDTIIGKRVVMAPECIILTKNKKFNKDELCYRGYEDVKPVTIGDRCWICTRVIILPGVTIGEGCVIGAGAVVAKDMPPYSVVVGNPAIAVKSLLDE